MATFDLGKEISLAREFATQVHGEYVQYLRKHGISESDSGNQFAVNASDLWKARDLAFKCESEADVSKLNERISELLKAIKA
ncbi:MAG: hypothetical protein IKH27_12025 [Oscillospiraceae bacterium]|nr:hypothetical protein [Oscillospiraceae bacterium]